MVLKRNMTRLMLATTGNICAPHITPGLAFLARLSAGRSFAISLPTGTCRHYLRNAVTTPQPYRGCAPFALRNMPTTRRATHLLPYAATARYLSVCAANAACTLSALRDATCYTAY